MAEEPNRTPPGAPPPVATTEVVSGGASTGGWPADDLDPELIRLRRKPHRPRPLVALAILVLAGYLAVLRWADLRYWLSAHVALDLGPATRALHEPLPDNAFVTVHGAPLRTLFAVLSERGSSDVTLVAPLAGAGGRLLLDLEPTPRKLPDVFDDAHSGRLRRLDRLDSAATIRGHFARMVAPRYVRVPDLLSALDARAPSVKDELGEDVPLSPAESALLTVEVPEDQILSFDEGRFTRAEAGDITRRLVSASGGAAAAASSAGERPGWFGFVVRLPGGVSGAAAAAVRQALAPYAAAGTAALTPRLVSIEAPLSHVHAGRDRTALAIDPTGLPEDALPVRYTLGGAPPSAASLVPAPGPGIVELPASTVTRARILASAAPPAETWILLEGDDPSRYWYLLPLYAALLAVVIFNALALRAGLRKARSA